MGIPGRTVIILNRRPFGATVSQSANRRRQRRRTQPELSERGWNSTVDLLSSLNRKTAACASERSGFEKFETAFETLYGESLDSFSQKVWAYAGLS